jgi:dihydrofolate reductase
MTQLLAGMTVSLDGFVEGAPGQNVSMSVNEDAALASAQLAAAIESTGAVLMGRRTFDMAEDPDLYADHYEFQVPIFVVTHRPPTKPPKENEALTFTFVTEGVESAAAQARAAAGDRDVTVVGGPDVIRQLLVAGLVDVLEMDVVPVLLGSGTRFLDSPSLAGIPLDLEYVQEIGSRTTLGFRVG